MTEQIIIFFEIVFIEFKILLSDFESKLEVASSNNIILGFFSTALAIAILCLCPPESIVPLSPTIVLVPAICQGPPSLASVLDY